MLQESNLSDLKEIFKRGDGGLRALYLPKLEEVVAAVEKLKGLGLRVVLTAGVYDMLHDGHVKYLRKGREQGDVLVVGIDTDERVRERKGPNRPVAGLEERLYVLSDMRFVDILTLVEPNADPAYVVKAIQPDVLVLSETTSDITSDSTDDIKAHCPNTEIVRLPPQSGNTTTARLRKLIIEDNLGVLTKAEDQIELARKSVHALREELLAEQNGGSHPEISDAEFPESEKGKTA